MPGQNFGNPFDLTGMVDRGGNYERLAGFGSYSEAQALVDWLSDRGFPVANARIVGDGIRTVEQVTGRRTKASATGTGAASGAWFGLFIGLLFTLFAVGPLWIWVLIIAVVIGAIWGAIFGFASHAMTRGKRDFASTEYLSASHYDVCVDSAYAQHARSLLGEMDGTQTATGGTQTATGGTQVATGGTQVATGVAPVSPGAAAAGAPGYQDRPSGTSGF